MSKAFLCAAVIVLSCGLAVAQQYQVLYTFAGSQVGDGSNPVSGLLLDNAGNLYGTTSTGGSSAFPAGSVFKLSPNSDGTWTETVLYSFCASQVNLLCLDGASPKAGLISDAKGNLYGTTYTGGSNLCAFVSAGCGNVFELSPPSSPDGQWTETVLYNFCSDSSNGVCLDGALPTSRLTISASGNLYGTTTQGGNGHYADAGGGGVVFKLSKGAGGWTETVLYNFCTLGQGNFCPDGSSPQAGVTFDHSGNLFGTTELGGALHSQGGGTVYKLSPGGNGWTETVLGTSTPPFGAGAFPLGTVSFDPLGNLYSTLSLGGAGAGGVFRLGPKGAATEFLFSGTDGARPAAGVLIDAKHPALYGTTQIGGANTSGVVFKMVTPNQESVLYSFCSQPSCSDGRAPLASVIEDKTGNLFGTASAGGNNNQGVVFEIVQSFPKRKASQHPPVWHTILPSKK